MGRRGSLLGWLGVLLAAFFPSSKGKKKEKEVVSS